MNRILTLILRSGLLLVVGLFPCRAWAEDAVPPAARLLGALTPRPLGPATMGGRVVDLAVVPAHSETIYVAAATGGLWKTTNNGSTWTPVFDTQSTQSLGAVAVAPSNPDVVWVGTGEANPRNSVSWGNGVYKSTDGGKTWKHMGLPESHHVGRIVIHPKNADIVYVAALGHLWGPNPERGVYMTEDGGKSWTRSAFLSENTGFVDLALDPSDPATVYGVAYTVRRGPFSSNTPADYPATQFGPEAGLYVTRDGGKTWKRLIEGLPGNDIGRCGIDLCRRDPRILYAVVETDRTAHQRGAELGQAQKPGGHPEVGGVFRSEDRGHTWVKVNDLCPRGFYFSQVRVDPNDPRHVVVLGVTVHISLDGGRTFRSTAEKSLHADHHAFWIDPKYPTHLIDGSDGGLAFSYDGGGTWEQLRNLPIAQFYSVAADLRRPFRVFGGLQDNGSWGGPSATHHREGIGIADWFRLASADGFVCQADPEDRETVYCEGQYGMFLRRFNTRLGTEREIHPHSPSGKSYRFNWCAPLLISPHNAQTLYFGGNVLFRSVDRGETWQEVSPDLTRYDSGEAHNNHSLTTIAESPLKAGVLYVGADDGRVAMTRDGGSKWFDLSETLPDVPPERWITRIECSHFDEGTAYLALDRHRQDDRHPYLFKTTDYGRSWKPLGAGLPDDAPVQVVREDPGNRELLFVGTEFGLFLSLDGGAHWQPFHKEFPAVPVYDLVVHPRDRQLVIATHGRGIYVLDVEPLEELTTEAMSKPVHLCEVRPAVLVHYRPSRNLSGGKIYNAPNPPYGAVIWYHLAEKPAGTLQIVVTDSQGKSVAVLKAAGDPGLHQVVWDLRALASEAVEPPLVKPGEYEVRLQAGERILAKRKCKVEADE